MTSFKRSVATWARWLHIYLSMFSFAALLFFAITGITLNHTNWIEGQQKVMQVSGQLPPALADSTKSMDQLRCVEYLRAQHGIKAPVKDFLTEESEYTVSFKGPGYSADCFIDRSTGEYDLTMTASGFIAVMNDLHKGRDTGTSWSWLIDISAVLIVLVSITGFAMIFFLAKKRTSGLLITGLGLIALLITYLFIYY